LRAPSLVVLGELAPGLSHFLQDFPVTLDLGIARETATFLGKFPILR
jgi:hypothetical protein